jgi:hypothetical protein
VKKSDLEIDVEARRVQHSLYTELEKTPDTWAIFSLQVCLGLQRCDQPKGSETSPPMP